MIIKLRNKIIKIFNMVKKCLGDNDPALHDHVKKIPLLKRPKF